MRYYIIAGEASGDLHASNLMKSISAKDPNAEFRCWGGDLMEAAGGEIVKHYRDLAFMGFLEVLANIRTIMRNIKFCKADIAEWKPDAVILVDYPGFNLRIAEFVKSLGIKVFYYISPQIWAWKEGRVHKIKKVVDRMYVILPFEKDFYKKHNVDVDFVGHPLLDAMADREQAKPPFEEFCKQHGLSNKPIIALLPGSRKQEISVKLPIMLSVIEHYPDYQFVIGAAPSMSLDFYKEMTANSNVGIVQDATYNLFQQSHAALVTSGTATLEAALFEVPEVVCYKGSKVSYLIARQLVKIDYISLVNLIMDREVVKELIQDELNKTQLKQELDKILDETYRAKLAADYKDLKEKLGGSGASNNAATLMLARLGVEG